MIKAIVPVVAIVAIVVIEVVALSSGIDGTLLSASFAAIGGLCGYWIKSLKKK
jgi:hypothetical protein